MKSKLKTLGKSALIISITITGILAYLNGVESLQALPQMQPRTQAICAMDNTTMSPTGQYQILPSGRKAYQYRCPFGHTTWIVDAN